MTEEAVLHLARTLLVARSPASPFHRSVAAAIAAAGMIELANALGAIDIARFVEWRRAALIFELLFPVALQYVGLAFLKKIPDRRRGECSAMEGAHNALWE